MQTRGKYAGIIVTVLALFTFGGCNNCEKMTEKLCSDLGAEDCALWKKSGFDQSLMPGGRKVNSACGTMMSDAVYPKVLQGARQQVAALHKIEKAKAAVPH
jgi:hypothetical protein